MRFFPMWARSLINSFNFHILIWKEVNFMHTDWEPPQKKNVGTEFCSNLTILYDPQSHVTHVDNVAVEYGLILIV